MSAHTTVRINDSRQVTALLVVKKSVAVPVQQRQFPGSKTLVYNV